jgi:hypothetical protein
LLSALQLLLARFGQNLFVLATNDPVSKRAIYEATTRASLVSLSLLPPQDHLVEARGSDRPALLQKASPYKPSFIPRTGRSILKYLRDTLNTKDLLTAE